VARWSDLAAAEPELAAFGAERLTRPPAYLATIRADGAPRVHPVTPIVTDEGLYVFMEPTSPKGRDLRERERFALHTGVPDNAGSGGEFWLGGRARLIDDAAVRATVAAAASYEPAERYVLFELEPDEARANGYDDVKMPPRTRWHDG
jgi:Pyridoxamine 5'-phosphate oxidase